MFDLLELITDDPFRLNIFWKNSTNSSPVLFFFFLIHFQGNLLLRFANWSWINFNRSLQTLAVFFNFFFFFRSTMVTSFDLHFKNIPNYHLQSHPITLVTFNGFLFCCPKLLVWISFKSSIRLLRLAYYFGRKTFSMPLCPTKRFNDIILNNRATLRYYCLYTDSYQSTYYVCLCMRSR